MDSSSDNLNNSSLEEILKRLELRISRIESHLQLSSEHSEEEFEKLSIPKFKNKNKEESSLELQLGEYWFPKVGIVVLALGIIFLLTLPYKNLPSFLPALFGYIISGGIIFISYKWKSSYESISRYMFGGSQLLLYFSTLRLYYFGESKLIESNTILIILLGIVVAVNLFVSVRRNSIYLTNFNLALAYLTILLSDNTFIILIFTALLAGLSVYFKLKNNWQGIIPVSLILSYLTYFCLLINNPIAGNSIQFISGPSIALFFPLIYLMIFAGSNYTRDSGRDENFRYATNVILNLFFAYGLFSATLFSFKLSYPFIYNYIAAILFLTISLLFWRKYQSKYTTFFYAMFGYGALSLGIIQHFSSPEFFVVLSWQSVIVVSTAIVFRSKIIIVANFIIFLLILTAFIIIAGEFSLISLSFGIVALLTARILNWKKEQLDLKTEQMRNAYLVVAFFIMPYALYHSIPKDYLIISWLGVTLFYYGMSKLLNNAKYRLMGHLTLILTVIYTLIIGTTELAPEFRVLSFIVIGIALITVSIVYTRAKLKNQTNDKKE